MVKISILLLFNNFFKFVRNFNGIYQLFFVIPFFKFFTYFFLKVLLYFFDKYCPSFFGHFQGRKFFCPTFYCLFPVWYYFKSIIKENSFIYHYLFNFMTKFNCNLFGIESFLIRDTDCLIATYLHFFGKCHSFIQDPLFSTLNLLNRNLFQSKFFETSFFHILKILYNLCYFKTINLSFSSSFLICYNC